MNVSKSRSKVKHAHSSETIYRSKTGSRKRQPSHHPSRLGGGRRGENFDYRAFWQRIERDYFQKVESQDLTLRARKPKDPEAKSKKEQNFLLDYSDHIVHLERSLARLKLPPHIKEDFVKPRQVFLDYATGDEQPDTQEIESYLCIGYSLTPTSRDIPDVEKDRLLEKEIKDTPINDELKSLTKLYETVKTQNNRKMERLKQKLTNKELNHMLPDEIQDQYSDALLDYMHIRIIELEKAQIAESMLGFIMKRYPPGEFLIVFDENVIEEPLWVRESDWDELMGMRHNIKVKNFTYYDNLGPKRDTRLPIAGQELDFSSVLSDQEDLERTKSSTKSKYRTPSPKKGGPGRKQKYDRSKSIASKWRAKALLTRQYCHHCKQLIDKTSLAQCNYNLRRYGPSMIEGEEEPQLILKSTSTQKSGKAEKTQIEEKKKDTSPQNIQKSRSGRVIREPQVPGRKNSDFEYNMSRVLSKCGGGERSRCARQGDECRRGERIKEFQCKRYFCGICLHNNYDEEFERVRIDPNWLCPYCQGTCYCTRCLRQDQLFQLRNIFIARGGQLTKSSHFMKHPPSIIEQKIFRTFELIKNTTIVTKPPPKPKLLSKKVCDEEIERRKQEQQRATEKKQKELAEHVLRVWEQRKQEQKLKQVNVNQSGCQLIQNTMQAILMKLQSARSTFQKEIAHNNVKAIERERRLFRQKVETLKAKRMQPVGLKCELKALRNSPIYDKPMPLDRSERRENLAQPKILLRELNSEEASLQSEPLVKKRKIASLKSSSSSLIKTPSPKMLHRFDDKYSPMMLAQLGEEKETQTTGESTPPPETSKLQKRKYNLVSPVITVSCIERDSEDSDYTRKREIMLRHKQHSPEEFKMLSYFKPHKKKRIKV